MKGNNLIIVIGNQKGGVGKIIFIVCIGVVFVL